MGVVEEGIPEFASIIPNIEPGETHLLLGTRWAVFFSVPEFFRQRTNEKALSKSKTVAIVESVWI